MNDKLYTIIALRYRDDNDLEEFTDLTRDQAINKIADLESIVDKYDKWSHIYLFEQIDWEVEAAIRAEAAAKAVPLLAAKKLKAEEETINKKLYWEEQAKKQRLAQYKLLKDEFE